MLFGKISRTFDQPLLGYGVGSVRLSERRRLTGLVGLMSAVVSVNTRQPRSPSPSYRGRPAIIFGSAFVVPAVAETEQGSPAHGQPDLHRPLR